MDDLLVCLSVPNTVYEIWRRKRFTWQWREREVTVGGEGTGIQCKSLANLSELHNCPLIKARASILSSGARFRCKLRYEQELKNNKKGESMWQKPTLSVNREWCEEGEERIRDESERSLGVCTRQTTPPLYLTLGCSRMEREGERGWGKNRGSH